MLDAAVQRTLAQIGHPDAVVAASLLGERAAAGQPGRYEIGSVTKLFTSLALALAVEAGDIALEEPLPGRAAITARGLATHTSRLPRLPRGFWRRILRQPDDPHAGTTPGEVLAVLDRRPPAAWRRGRYRYSNLGAAVLGQHLARLAGRDFGALVAARLCRPLELGDTGIAAPEDLLPGHTARGRRVPHWRLDAFAPAGGLAGTAEDLLTFLEATLEPPPWLATAAALATREHARVDDQLSVGLGWHRERLGDAGSLVLWHNGGTGGFSSFVAVLPERGATLAVLANRAKPVDRAARALAKELAGG